MHKKILIIEDDPDIIALYENIFQHTKLQTTFCNSSEKSIKMIEENNPDLIILDLVMPGILGFEICSYVKQSPTLKNIHVIAVTGYGTDEIKKKIQRAGFDDYLLKPFDISVLCSKIKKILLIDDKTL